MKFSLAVAAATTLAALAAARPTVDLTKRTDETGYAGAAYVGTLYEPAPGASFPLGQNITFAYESTSRTDEGGPKPSASKVDVNVLLQGPAPITPKQDFLPWGQLEVATGLDVGGPGGWVNGSVALPSIIRTPGEYFLIFEERQRPSYDSEQPTFRVQAYNLSITLTEAEPTA